MNTLEQALPKQKSGSYLLMGLLACFFALVIVREDVISRFILLGMAFIGGLVFFKKEFLRQDMVISLLVTYLPFSKQIQGGFGHLIPGLNLTNALIALAVIFWLKEKNKEKGSIWLNTSLNLPIYLFLLMGFISIFRGATYGVDYLAEATLRYFRIWFLPIFLYFLTINTVRDREEVKNVAIIIMIVTTLVGLMAIHEYLQTDDRVGGVFDEPNYLAAFFNYYMFLPLGFLLLNRNRLKYWTLLIPFLICFRGLMVSFSRAGYLAFAASSYAIAFFRSRFSLFFVVLATVAVLLNPALLPEGIRYRMAQTIQKSSAQMEAAESGASSLDQSAGDRIKLWHASVAMIQEHPFLGIGYHLFESKVMHYWTGTRTYNPHNTYLHIAVEMGIPTLIIFLWILGLVFWNTLRLYKTSHDLFAKALALGFLGGLFGFLVSNLYGARFNSSEMSSYFWILCALIMRLRMLEGNTQS